MGEQILAREILLKDFANCSDELFNLGIIRTDSFTGEIGEFIASKYFNLRLVGKSTKAYDAKCSQGYKYQIKSKILTKKSLNCSISNLKCLAFDFLIVVYFDEYYNPLYILKIPSKEISAEKYYVNSSVISMYSLDVNLLRLSEKEKSAIKNFALSYLNLRKANIIRSRRVVGDIGEYYACRRLNLKLCNNVNEKGLDAINQKGLTFEIKTRRVYDSGRRTSEARRLNKLKGKNADYLIVVTLNHAFECSGMWIMPMKNVVNPDSAHLTIVNKIIGVRNLVPSQINGLETGEKFVSFNEMNRQKQSLVLNNKQNERQSELADIIVPASGNHKGMYLILLVIIGFILVCLAF
ncbi:hypothetical protein [uncultured Phocaeicola sp.]|uniref:DUF6998 domain-containing protein n=1 Tax=uncultured Phocaeicola sp. TaxID=990718 RepID=UPI002593B033|nr:hypothetical protein [uncultured Phocaeicola sp.]